MKPRSKQADKLNICLPLHNKIFYIELTMNAFYPLSAFPKIAILAKEWQIIRSELLNLNAPIMNINRDNKSHLQVLAEVEAEFARTGIYGWLEGWSIDGIGNSHWLQYGLVAFGQNIPPAEKYMPKTIKLLAPIKDAIKVCALCNLKAGTLLGLHKHPEIREEGLLQAHITIDTPDQQNFSYLNVNGEFFQHLKGQSAVFDGSLPHFAVNASKNDRIILYLEFSKNKLMNP